MKTLQASIEPQSFKRWNLLIKNKKTVFVAIILCTVNLTYAKDPALPVLLKCDISGLLSTSFGDDKFSETIEVDVNDSLDVFFLEVNGSNVMGGFSGRSFVGESGAQHTGKNRSTSTAWELTDSTVNKDGTSLDSSVRIDRRTGSFAFRGTITTSKNRTTTTMASGKCSKVSGTKRF